MDRQGCPSGLSVCALCAWAACIALGPWLGLGNVRRFIDPERGRAGWKKDRTVSTADNEREFPRSKELPLRLLYPLELEKFAVLITAIVFHRHSTLLDVAARATPTSAATAPLCLPLGIVHAKDFLRRCSILARLVESPPYEPREPYGEPTLSARC